MGMFDWIEVEKMVLVKDCPPILPIGNYQTKSLNNTMEEYSLEEATKRFKSHDYEEEIFRIYAVFDSELLMELMKEKEINQASFFWIDSFSEAARSKWLEYALTIESGEIKKIRLVTR